MPSLVAGWKAGNVLKFLEGVYNVYQAFLWVIWIPLVHLPACEPVERAFFYVADWMPYRRGAVCDHAQGSLVGTLMAALAFVCFLIVRSNTRRQRAWQVAQEKAAVSKAQAEQANQRALAVREDEQRQLAEKAEKTRRRREYNVERAAERLPVLERTFLIEWGHFKAQHDPYDDKDISAIRKQYRGQFLKRYPVDAPILRLSNDPHVRAIVFEDLNTWPQLDPDQI